MQIIQCDVRAFHWPRQANSFRRQMRSVLGPCDVSLVIVMEGESRGCEVRVVYEREDAEQVGWVSEAKRIAEEVWASFRNRRRGVAV